MDRMNLAFTPDIKTMSRNIYLQRRLSVQCEFLDKEKQSFKRRYEDKQKECVEVLKRLQVDCRRYGLPVRKFSFRPDSSSSEGFRERSKSVCSASAKTLQENPPRRRASSHGQAELKQGYVNDMKVYTFEKLENASPDVEAYTVYCHNPTRRISSGTPVSRIANLVPSAFSNYNSEIKWNEVQRISNNYMNRSERRDTLVDLRTPIVLADVCKASPSGFGQRSYSYSGPCRRLRTAPSDLLGRQRSATVSGAYSLNCINEQSKRQVTDNESGAEKPRTTDNSMSTVHETEKNVSEISCKDGAEKGHHDVPGEETKHTETEGVAKQTFPEDPQDQEGSGRRRLSPCKQKIRRVSAPSSMGYNTSARIARSSHEARMQRRLSQGRQPCNWVVKENEDRSESSESEDENANVYDASKYVQSQIDNFMSNLKCSDVLEDRVNSYLSTVKNTKHIVASRENTKAANKDNISNRKVLIHGNEDSNVRDDIKKAPKALGRQGKSLSQKKLVGLLKRPQMQLQMLLNKLRDANRAAERADRLKPKIKPKCTF